jgi:hypothetical protein
VGVGGTGVAARGRALLRATPDWEQAGVLVLDRRGGGAGAARIHVPIGLPEARAPACLAPPAAAPPVTPHGTAPTWHPPVPRRTPGTGTCTSSRCGRWAWPCETLSSSPCGTAPLHTVLLACSHPHLIAVLLLWSLAGWGCRLGWKAEGRPPTPGAPEPPPPPNCPSPSLHRTCRLLILLLGGAFFALGFAVVGLVLQVRPAGSSGGWEAGGLRGSPNGRAPAA